MPMITIVKIFVVLGVICFIVSWFLRCSAANFSPRSDCNSDDMHDPNE